MAYERKYILEKLKEASEILGRSPTEEDLSRLGFPSRKAYRNKFGTFEAAEELLGLKRKPKGGRKDAPKKIRFEIFGMVSGANTVALRHSSGQFYRSTT